MLREGEERKAGYLRPRLLLARRADGGSGRIPVSKAAALVCLTTLPYQTYRGDSPHRWQAQGSPFNLPCAGSPTDSSTLSHRVIKKIE